MKFDLLQLRLLSLIWLLAGLPSSLAAHDIPERYFDRGIELTIERDRMQIVYHLSLSRLTMAEELLSLVGSGGLSGRVESERMDLYAASMAPLLARGLILEVDGQPLEPAVQTSSHLMEDHARFHFQFSLALPESVQPERSLALEDTNFFLEKGVMRIAVRSGSDVRMVDSSVPDRLDEVEVRSAWEQTPEQQDAARRARVSWSVEPVRAEPSDRPGEQSAALVQVEPESSNRPRVDLTELLDRWPGQSGVVLLGLAFAFGAVHALTPGHGKTMVAAYLVGERGRLRHALALGLTTSLTHTSSVLGVALILRLAGGELHQKLNSGFALLSGVLVAGLGGWLLYVRVRGLYGSRAGLPLPDGVQAVGDGEVGSGGRGDRGPAWPGLVTLGVSGGVVPCPDAIALLFIATAKGQVEQAVYLLLSFSVGLAGALVAVGILAVKLRGFVSGTLGSGRLVQTLPVLSAATILVVGIYLCASTLERPVL